MHNIYRPENAAFPAVVRDETDGFAGGTESTHVIAVIKGKYKKNYVVIFIYLLFKMSNK